MAACEMVAAAWRIRDFITDRPRPDRPDPQTAIAEAEYYEMQTFDQTLAQALVE